MLRSNFAILVFSLALSACHSNDESAPAAAAAPDALSGTAWLNPCDDSTPPPSIFEITTPHTIAYRAITQFIPGGKFENNVEYFNSIGDCGSINNQLGTLRQVGTYLSGDWIPSHAGLKLDLVANKFYMTLSTADMVSYYNLHLPCGTAWAVGVEKDITDCSNMIPPSQVKSTRYASYLIAKSGQELRIPATLGTTEATRGLISSSSYYVAYPR